MSDLQDLSLTAQADAVRGRSVAPGELFAAARERVKLRDGSINSICATFDGAIEDELAPFAEGSLYGVPIAVKDMFSLPWRAPRDAAPVGGASSVRGMSGVARRLREAGALTVFVTNMHQLGIGTTGHISAYGPCRNPWDPARCAGGSSGGSAAAVAARMVGASVGTDAGGSIRVPASYCGVTGLKPTWGAVSVEGYTGAYSTMGVAGPIARGARDCRVLAEALLARPLATADPSTLRIGLLSGCWDDVDPGILEACRKTVGMLEGHGDEIGPATLADGQHVALAAMVVTGAERLPQLDQRWFDTVFPRLDPTVRAIIRARFTLSANTLQRVTRFRGLLRERVARLFDEFDLLVCPTVPCSPPPVDRPRVELPSGPASADATVLRHVGLANLTGIPAITTPCGTDALGLPVGLMFHAPWGREDLLLAVAERVESVTERAFVNCDVPAPEALTRGEE